jgi:hypothetical protein
LTAVTVLPVANGPLCQLRPVARSTVGPNVSETAPFYGYAPFTAQNALTASSHSTHLPMHIHTIERAHEPRTRERLAAKSLQQCHHSYVTISRPGTFYPGPGGSEATAPLIATYPVDLGQR